MITMTALFCDCNPETIEHLFWYCDQISPSGAPSQTGFGW